MNDLNQILKLLIEEKGGDISSYRNLMDAIAYHESAHTMDPSIKQLGGGPGRGKYQFEIGRHKGGITAAKRTKRYLQSKGVPIPKWLEEISQKNDLDASTLTSEQQDLLFLGNMRMHPKANLKNLFNGTESIADFWANYHWAGSNRDRKARLESFNKSFDKYKNSKLFSKKNVQTNNLQEKEIRPLPIQQKDVTNIKQPVVSKNLIKDLKQFSTGGQLNSYNEGGLHEVNPLGGIPIGNNATVEQGETSFNNKDGKFIFSDRINISDNEPDPIKEGKSFVKNWFNNPITKERFSKNLGLSMGETLKTIQQSLDNLEKAEVVNIPSTENADASYIPAFNRIMFHSKPEIDYAVHEYAHSMNDIDKLLSNKILKDYGAIPLSKADTLEEREHIQYLNRNGEIYPRIMEMRQALGVKPGDIITDEQIKKLKNTPRVNHLFQFYSDSDIKSILNTIADNNNYGKTDIRAV